MKAFKKYDEDSAECVVKCKQPEAGMSTTRKATMVVVSLTVASCLSFAYLVLEPELDE